MVGGWGDNQQHQQRQQAARKDVAVAQCAGSPFAFGGRPKQTAASQTAASHADTAVWSHCQWLSLAKDPGDGCRLRTPGLQFSMTHCYEDQRQPAARVDNDKQHHQQRQPAAHVDNDQQQHPPKCRWDGPMHPRSDWACPITTFADLTTPGLDMLLHISKPPPHCGSCQDEADSDGGQCLSVYPRNRLHCCQKRLCTQCFWSDEQRAGTRKQLQRR